MRPTKWLISVRSGDQRKDFVIRAQERETPQDTYRRAKAQAENLIKKVDGRATVDLISLTIAFKPKGKKPHKSRYWCPYCNQWRVFLYDGELDCNRCSICGISDKDFYVKKYNDVWKKEFMDKKIKL